MNYESAISIRPGTLVGKKAVSCSGAPLGKVTRSDNYSLEITGYLLGIPIFPLRRISPVEDILKVEDQCVHLCYEEDLYERHSSYHREPEYTNLYPNHYIVP